MSGTHDGMPALPPGSKLGILDRLLDRAERLLSSIASIILLAMGVLISVSVAAREQINVTIPDDILMVGLAMVAVVALPMAHVQRDKGQIAVTVITDRMPQRVGEIGRLLGNLLGCLLFGAIALLVMDSIPKAFAENHYYDGQLSIPVWPTKVIFGIGMGLFSIRLGLCMVGDLVTMKNRPKADH